MTHHPPESDLALYAGGDCGRIARIFLGRHIRNCAECASTVAEYEALLLAAPKFEPPVSDWDSLAREMAANIHVGLEAGACVGPVRHAASWKPTAWIPGTWEPRMVFAFASVLLLIGSAVVLNRPATPGNQPVSARTVIQSSDSGIQVLTGATSITLLNHHGAMAEQTVGAQGEIRARYIDGETGAVTINNVYLE